eukprot:CAMPEP_0114977314 /NCGR_PEP_ID=MMETSP0216-20121206/3168_1 /TAXON_ID=223996 /ORGANISM="Protocruzia adherens, Strain Boccale" /LENGTH=547 /DNA_ID=CAMNT_0002338357 /DNA_START=38 /DNA_END=1681 /DNA_ORIENTATION=+
MAEHNSKEDLEAKLADLRRRYRNLESDRKAYNEETQATIKKQRNTIDKLKKDNNFLKEELANQNNLLNKNNQTSAARLAGIETADSYKQKIEIEKKRLEEIEQDVKVFQDKILKQKRQMGGVNAAADNHAAVQKQIRILENRLDKANQKFNEAISHNKTLREEIDSLRRERVIFDEIYKKLERDLHNKRKEMANIIESANSAYEDRDKAQDQLASLKQRAEREQQEFEKEWKELNAAIEKDKKMKDFMKLKEKEKNDVDELKLNDVQEDAARRSKPRWNNFKAKTNFFVSAERVHSYEEAFSKIEKATGISDVEELVNTFIKAEEQNFALFKFVNELSNEIEKLESEIADIRNEIEKYKGQGSSVDNQRKKQLKDLEEKLSKTETKAEQYELKYQQSSKVVNSIKMSIESIFNTIECNDKVTMELLGNQSITDSNMMNYLGIIEQKTNDILQVYGLVEQEKARLEGDDTANVMNFGPQSGMSQGTIRIEVPNFSGDLSDENESDLDDDEKPLTREELKQKTLQIITKQQNQARSRQRGNAKMMKGRK